jgi:glucose 1-dehydrogenase/3-oxoacyl-[acyl-carrier protein] reductase
MKPAMFTLAGKIALVTGAARGIGRGIAEVFADAGADVAINDIDGGPAAQEAAESLRARGRRAVVVTADVARRQQVEPMFEQVGSTLGPVDILVNNAGIETIVPFLDLTDEQWTRLVDTNLRGAWLCSQVYCRRALTEGRPGSIVNIGSIEPLGRALYCLTETRYCPTQTRPSRRRRLHGTAVGGPCPRCSQSM